MSVTTMSPPIVLVAAMPEPPRFSLLSVAQRITQDRWQTGAGVLGNAVGPWDPYDADCLGGSPSLKNAPNEIPAPIFASFQSYLGIFCTGAGAGTWNEFQERTDRVARASAAWPLERQLVHGDPMSANPHLADANLTQLGADGIAPRIGLSYLEEAIGNTGLRGVIHTTPAIATAWSGLVRSKDDDVTENSELITTANGTPVAVGGGYTGADPADETAASGTREWAFATGPVQVAYSGVIANPDDISEALDREVNDLVYRAELDLLVAWDTQLQVGVLIDWAL